MKKIKEFIYPNNLKINYINNMLNIVNYDEINLLTEKIITIIKNQKEIIIHGDNLTIIKLLDNEILIAGKINKIEL